MKSPLLLLFCTSALTADESLSNTLGMVLADWMPRRYAVEVEREDVGHIEHTGRWEFSVDQRIPVIMASDLDDTVTGGFYFSLDTGLAVDGDLTRFRLGWTIGAVGIVTLSEDVRALGLLGVGEDLQFIDLPADQSDLLDQQRAFLATSHAEAILALLIGEPDGMSLGFFGGFLGSTGSSRWYDDDITTVSASEWGPMLGMTLAHRW